MNYREHDEQAARAATHSIADVFVWDSRFETGIAEIDRQHRELVKLINMMGHILAVEADPEAFTRALCAVFDELARYIEYHLRFEESLMGQLQDDREHEAAHKRAHAGFIAQLAESRQAINERPAEVAGKMLTYLSKWLLTHIVVTDMHLARKILAMQSGLSEQEACRQAGDFMGSATEALLFAMERLYENLARRTDDLLEAKRSLDREVAMRRRIEDELRRLLRAVEYSPVSIIITDADGNFEYVNPRFTELTGYTLGELAGKTPRVLRGDAASQDKYDCLWATIRAGGEWHGELLNRKKSGELYWDNAAISPVFDVNGKISHYVSIQENFTEHKQAEAKLRQQKQFSDDIIDSLPGIFYMLDDTGKFVRVNRQFLAVTGYEQAELDRLGALDFFAGEDRNLIAARMSEVFERGDARAEADFITKSGQHIPYYFTGHRTSIDGRFYLVGLGTDITERRMLEAELVRQARTDSLTGLFNRRHFIELATQEFLRAGRYGEPLSVLMLDLDEFKAINDRHGHQAGDSILRGIGEVCRQALRGVDIVGRLGGEEFAVLLPETAARQAAEAAERLRQDIAAAAIVLESGAALRVTASIGVSTLASGDADFDKLLSRADKAMYQAKRSGRNRVAVLSAA